MFFTKSQINIFRLLIFIFWFFYIYIWKKQFERILFVFSFHQSHWTHQQIEESSTKQLEDSSGSNQGPRLCKTIFETSWSQQDLYNFANCIGGSNHSWVLEKLNVIKAVSEFLQLATDDFISQSTNNVPVLLQKFYIKCLMMKELLKP